jgi:hypothetical protein
VLKREQVLTAVDVPCTHKHAPTAATQVLTRYDDCNSLLHSVAEEVQQHVLLPMHQGARRQVRVRGAGVLWL